MTFCESGDVTTTQTTRPSKGLLAALCGAVAAIMGGDDKDGPGSVDGDGMGRWIKWMVGKTLEWMITAEFCY